MAVAVDVPSESGPTRGYLATPDIGEGTPVLILHGGRGLTPFFPSFADRLAKDGHLALALDLYEGQVATTPGESDRLFRDFDRRSRATHDRLSGAVDYLVAHPAATVPGIGVIGFSLGGRLALALTDPSARSDRVRAAVTFYGLNPGVDYARSQSAYLGHFAENDPFHPGTEVRQQETVLREARRDVEFFVYPGTRHGFFESDRPEHDADAAEVAWDRTLSFLDHRLR